MQGNALMEEIMADIGPHLKPVIDMGARGNVHHYNRVWEKIEEWHNRHVGEDTRTPQKEE
jgi:hypothetical protein